MSFYLVRRVKKIFQKTCNTEQYDESFEKINLSRVCKYTLLDLFSNVFNNSNPIAFIQYNI